MNKFLGLALGIALSSASAAPVLAGTPTAPSDDSLGALSSTSSPTAGTVYTANENGNSLSAVNPSGQEVETVSVLISPHNVQVSADGRLLLAVGGLAAESAGHGHDEKRGMLLVFDARALDRGPVSTVKVGRHPAHVVVDAAAERAFVTNSEDNSLSVIDLSQSRVVREIGTGESPHGLRIGSDGRELYVANVKGGSVSVIETAALREVARIPVGRAPVQVGFAPDGRRVYVSLRDENSVAVIDTSTRQVIAKVPVGRGPIQVFATPDGASVLVANQGTAEQPDDTVSVIDTATNRVAATIETGRGAHGVVVSPDGRQAYVSNILENSVSVIDVAARRVVRTVAVGEGPNGITFRGAVQ
jgi:YVTN family beta-propeller protein